MNTKAADFVVHTVSDTDQSVSFYKDTPGVDLETLNEVADWAEFALPPTTFALGEVNPMVPLEPNRSLSGAGDVPRPDEAVQPLTSD